MKAKESNVHLNTQYQTLFTCIRDSILVVNNKREIVNCNPAFTSLFGYSLQEIKGEKPAFIYQTPDEYQKVGKLFTRLTETGMVIPEITFIKKNKTIFPGEVTFSVIKDKEGNTTGYMGVVRDITQRKQRLDEIHSLHSQVQQEQRLRFLAEASEILSSSLDYRKTLGNVAKLIVPRFADWCIIDILDKNDILLNLALIHQDPKKAALIQQLKEKNSSEIDKSKIKEVVKSGVSEVLDDFPKSFAHIFPSTEVLNKHKNSIAIKSAIIVPMRGREAIFGAISFIRETNTNSFSKDDVLLAEQIAHRAGLAIDNAILYEQTKEGIKERDDFLNIASHELKTPITSLQLQTQLLRYKATTKDSIDKEDVRKCLDVSERQIKRLSQLINNLLDISRITNNKFSLKKEHVDLSKLVHEVIDRMELTAKHAGSDIILHNSKHIVGHWDKVRMDQVTTNLLSNALKYGEGKPITIEIGTNGNDAFLSIKDQGMGIDPEDIDKIFKRFERTKSVEKYGGLGMGLYIVNQIVNAHNGEIKVTSQPGQGSSFTVYLPLE